MLTRPVKVWTAVIAAATVFFSGGCSTTNIVADGGENNRCAAEVEQAVRQAVDHERRDLAERHATEIESLERQHARKIAALQEQHARSVEHLRFELASAEQQIADTASEVSALRAATQASDVRTREVMASNRLLKGQLALAERQMEELKRIASAPREKRPDALKDITLGTAAVHCPERMKQGVEYDLTAAVSMIEKDAALLQQVGGPNASSGAWETPVAKTMAVWVEAPAFAVKPEKQERQLVVGTPAKWTWKVRPLRAGKHESSSMLQWSFRLMVSKRSESSNCRLERLPSMSIVFMSRRSLRRATGSG
jgi:hypothetical protein